MNKNTKTLYPIPHTLHPRAGGFTLVEMVVASGLFIIVLLTGLGALTNMSAAAQKTKSSSVVMDNLNFAFESMTRSMRTGVNYHCGSDGDTTPLDCPTFGGNGITFRDSLGRTVVYALQNNAIERSINGESPLGITAPEITVETLGFYVDGSGANDSRQPRILIILRGIAGTVEGTKTRFDIQTMVTQRLPDS